MWHACFIDQHCQDFKSLNLEKNLRHGIIYLLKELEFVLGCHPLYCFKFVHFHKILYQVTFQQNLFSKNKIVRRRHDLNFFVAYCSYCILFVNKVFSIPTIYTTAVIQIIIDNKVYIMINAQEARRKVNSSIYAILHTYMFIYVYMTCICVCMCFIFSELILYV